MATDKLKKLIAELESRQQELLRHRDDRLGRASTLEARRKEMVSAALAEGGQPRDSEKQIEEIQKLRQAAADYDSGVTAVAEKLASLRSELLDAERAETVVVLEKQIDHLSMDGGEVELALQSLRTATAVIFESVRKAAALLNSTDAERWPVGFANRLELSLRQSLVAAVAEFGFLKEFPTARQSIFESVEPVLRSCAQQLRFEAGEFSTPGRGQRLYRALNRIHGLRHGVTVPPHAVIALDENEAKPLLKNNSLELVTEAA